MAKKRVYLEGDPFSFARKMLKKKLDFKIALSSASVKITLESKGQTFDYIFGDRWKMKDLGLFSQTKAHLRRLDDPPPEPRGIDYVMLEPPQGKVLEVFDNVAALDITGAYTSAAQILGYFSGDIARKYEDYDKLGRLKAFGATAKRAEVFEFKEGILVRKGVEKSETRTYFLNAAAYVSEALKDVRAALGSDFIFYWVDCCFFVDTPENREKAKKVFDRHGFQTHMEAVKFMIYRREPTYHIIERYEDGKEVKKYTFPVTDNVEGKNAKFAKYLNQKTK